MTAARSLLGNAIDYAGLFPPAALNMKSAVAEYAAVRASDDAWALGRFMLPADRFEMFAVEREFLPPSAGTWLVAVACGDDLAGDLHRIAVLPARLPQTLARVDTVEFRAPTLDALLDGLAAVPTTFTRFVEIPLSADPIPLVAQLKRAGAGAKFRTGGVVATAIPEPELLLRALDAVVRAALPFKCTAGLHHPVRGTYRLTYAPDSPTGLMHGYLNVMLAAAALQQRAGLVTARAILLETVPAAFVIGKDWVRWRDVTFDRDTIRALRRRGFRTFGSCSFREPVDELGALGTA